MQLNDTRPPQTPFQHRPIQFLLPKNQPPLRTPLQKNNATALHTRRFGSTARRPPIPARDLGAEKSMPEERKQLLISQLRAARDLRKRKDRH
ncbi:hypothetical protein H0H87_012243 [Tephrocybe sp. NHM501043]|nr:hypothetical protein H0H87_012243 [Tephrocybe sp. NHM501043]